MHLNELHCAHQSSENLVKIQILVHNFPTEVHNVSFLTSPGDAGPWITLGIEEV